MAKTVETRVVEMRFDNKNFEKGAKDTMSTLARLKEALNFTKSTEAIKSLSDATKEFTVDKLANSLQVLENRFSTMGIVGMRVIERLTDAMINTLAKGVNFVSDAIISGGIRRAMNIENAHFQLQALLKDEAKVQAVMDNAMEAVDGTAYAYDEAAKAASQFSASGIEAGEDMLNALKGITGVAAMTNSEFEAISMIFTTVAGNGRLMGDQLLQLSSRGLNAASTITDYFKEVRGQAGMTETEVRDMVSKGKISFKDFSDAMTWAFGDSAKRANETFNGAMSNMKSAFARIGAGFVSPLVEQNGELVKLFNALRVQVNNVKSALVFDEQKSAISGLSKVVKLSTDDINKLFSDIKKEGKLSSDILDQFQTHGADAVGALTTYINGVTKGTIRGTYAVTSAIETMTGGLEISSDQVREFVENGQVDLAIFTSAMETEYGDMRALTKQFTDFFLDHVSNLVKAIESTDLTKPMEGFYYILEAVKNVLKGIWSIIGPLAGAFKDVFLSFSGQDFVDFAAGLEEFTAKLTLTEKGSKNLHDTFEGLFSVVKLVMDVIFKLIGATTHTVGPITSMAELILSLTGALGRALTAITNFIGKSKLLNGALNLINKTVKLLTSAIKTIISFVYDLTETVFGMIPVEKILNTISKAFEKLSIKASPYIDILIEKLKDLREWAIDFFPDKARKASSAFVKAMKTIWRELKNFDLSSPLRWLNALKEKMQELAELAMSNKGFAAFIKHMKEFGQAVKEAFTFDKLIENLNKFKDTLISFGQWLSSKFGPMFKNFTIGDAVGIAGGISMLKILYDIAKKLGGMLDKLGEVTGVFKSLKGVLSEYQKNLKANYLLKIAAAIGILAVSLVLLSFADTDRMIKAAVALGILGGILLAAIVIMTKAANSGLTMQKALSKFTYSLSSSMTNLAKAAKWKAIGSLAKSIGESLLMVALSIVAIGLLYKKDKQAFKVASIAVGVIAVAIVAIVGLMTKITKSARNAKSMTSAALAMVGICASLLLVVSALKKIMKMKLPNDYQEKFLILSGILLELAGLMIVVGIASKISGGKKFKPTSFVTLALMLNVTVSSLKKLFKINLPDDYNTKVDILKDVFRRVEELLLVMAVASKISGKTMKAGGTMLGMAVFIATIVAALAILAIFPGERLKKGAEALGTVLMMLGISLAGAGKIGGAGSAKTVLAMAIAMGAIVASLAFLSVMDFNKMKNSAIVLGGVLLALAVNFNNIGKINSAKSLPVIVAMLLTMVEIAGILYLLSAQPWEGIIAAGGGLAAALIGLGVCFKLLNDIKIDLKTIGLFLLGTLSLIPIAAALYLLSEQPWEGMIAAAGGLATLLMSLSGALVLLTKFHVGLKEAIKAAAAIDIFMAGVVLPLGALAALLGEIFGDSDLSSLESGMDLLAELCYGVGKAIGSLLGGAIEGALSFIPALGEMIDEFWNNIKPFATEVGELPQQTFLNMVELAGALIVFGAAELITGIAALISGGGALAAVGKELSDFIINAMPFFASVSLITPETVEAAKNVASMIMALTLAELLQGVMEFLGMSGSLSSFGEELASFGPAIRQFAEDVNGIDANSVKGAAAACEIMANAAKNLPGTDGLLQKIFGEKSLKDFGEELVSFGPDIVEFANTVDGINTEAVKAAAAACDIMSAAADNLPASNGLAQKIFGDHSLAEFGEELVSFGPAIVEFADTVKDVNPQAVTGAAKACEIMSAVANGLPEGDSVWSFFTGKPKDMDDFGEELVVLGECISGFAEKVKDVKASSVTAAAKAIEVMSTVASKLPEDSSVWSFLSGGKSKDLDDFGKELKKLGPHIAEFADKVKDIRTSAVTGAVNVAEMMVTLAERLPDKDDVEDKVGLDEFGEELASFGPNIASFSRDVKDIQIGAVQGASSACKIMAECAKYLPGVDGFAQEVFGEKSLSDFGYELQSFGPRIKAFADEVADINPTTVEGAAAAAKIMAECANNLPASDGLKQQIFGEKSLSDFGGQLESFGPSIKKFSDDVKEIDTGGVQGAAQAASIMSTLAKNLPGNEGLIQQIFGDKSLSDFGAELVRFGPYIASFSKIVKDVNPQGASAAAQAASIMSEFSKTLEDTSGLKTLFGSSSKGKLTIFGEDLSGFATRFRAFYLHIEDIDIIKVNRAIDTFGSLVNLADYVSDDNTRALSEFIDDVASVGNIGINEFIQAFYDAQERVTNAIDEFLRHGKRTITNHKKILTDECYKLGEDICNGIKDGITNKQKYAISTALILATSIHSTIGLALIKNKFNTIGSDIVEGIVEGMKSAQNSLKYKVETICSIINTTISTYIVYSTFYYIGSNIVGNLTSGIIDQRESTIYQIQSFCNSLISAFSNSLLYSTFYGIGTNTMTGFVDGINGSASNASSAMALVAGKALEAMQEKLEVHSPSEATYRFGQFVSQGLANGVISEMHTIQNASTNVSDRLLSIMEATAQGVAESIDNNPDFEPTIRPVLDLTNVKSGIHEANTMFNRNLDLLVLYRDAVGAISQPVNQNEQFVVNVNNDEVVDAIYGLNDKFDKLSDAVAGMQVILDSGALVGNIVNDMDNALGRRSKLRGRGV